MESNDERTSFVAGLLLQTQTFFFYAYVYVCHVNTYIYIDIMQENFTRAYAWMNFILYSPNSHDPFSNTAAFSSYFVFFLMNFFFFNTFFCVYMCTVSVIVYLTHDRQINLFIRIIREFFFSFFHELALIAPQFESNLLFLFRFFLGNLGDKSSCLI